MDILKAYSLKAFPVSQFQQPKKRQKVESIEAVETTSSNYICYNCRSSITLRPKSKIICQKCNCRILIKKTEKKSINYSCV